MQAQQNTIRESFKAEKFKIDDFANLKQLRDYMVNGPTEFCIERSKLLTEFFIEKGGLDYTDPSTRQAEGLYYILKNKKPNVFPYDLLAGSSTSKRKGVLFYPEFSGLGMWPELLTMPLRKHNPYKISAEEVRELNLSVLPFWIDKSAPELIRKKVGEDDVSYKLQQHIYLFMVSKYTCQSHTIPDYKRVLDKGLIKLIEEASSKLNNVKNENEGIFYKSLIIAMKGVLEYSNNLSNEALRQATKCNDEYRKNQLLKISEICKNVPAEPASTFWEALQSIWTCMNALYQEQNNVGFSIGRIDQLLNKYYIHDLEKGSITKNEAIELLSHFWLKIGDNIPMVPESWDMLFSGTGSNQAITIGGCDENGINAVNETTYLSLDVTELVHVRDPNVNARVRKDDPPEYTQRLAEVIINTGSTPSLINDDITIEALKDTGVSEEHARDYAQVGCLEPNSSGRTFGHTGAILINLISALGLVLNNSSSSRAENIGIKTGELTTFTDFNKFFNAVKEQLKFVISNATRFNNIFGEIYKYIHPQPLLAALFEGPLESGKSLLEGGATYNSSGIAFIALSDLIDSLYTIKKLVFDEKKISLPELKKIVDNNFENNEYLYNYIINKIDHFGNGKEEVDKIGVDLVDFLYEECRKIKNYREGFYNPGYWSMSIHSGFGKLTGAYPHGKRKGEALTSGLTPFSKSQKNGPTGVFNSLTNLPARKMPNGMALNMKFNKSMFQNQDKIEIFKSLIKGYFEKGGMQVQFTIHDAKELIEAKNNPEKYPDLMVRISGYTAYFKDLDEHMKNEIINRALMNLE